MTDTLKRPHVGKMQTDASDTAAPAATAEYKPRIYVCSPYRPRSKDPFAADEELECNIERAKTACRLVADLGGVPICSHLFCTQFLDDDIPEEREKGKKLGLEMLKDADELWCFSEHISEGMAAEIQEASKLSIPVRMICETAGLLKKVLAGFTEEMKLRKQREQDESCLRRNS